MSTLRGKAMHLNREVSVEILANGQKQHRLFVKDQLQGIWGTEELPFTEHERNTKAFGVAGVEHWSAALGLYVGQGLDFVLSDPEFPLFEGSAWIWSKALKIYGEVKTSYSEYSCPLEGQWQEGHATISVKEATSFSVEYILDDFKQSFVFTNRVTDTSTEIIPCRTFILEEDLLLAQKEGLLLGAKEGMGILLESTLPVSVKVGAPLRFSDEFVRHKILDLLGDLLLLRGALPKLHIVIRNGGHRSHLSLLKRMYSCLY